jgi:hypothetical protein
MSNSTSITVSFALIEFTSCSLLMLRNGLPKRQKHNASSMVDLPDPFVPTMSVADSLFKFSSVKKLPVLSKFFQRSFRNKIIQ